MTDISVNTNDVSVSDPQRAIVNDFIAGEAITAGQALYINSDGKAALASASAAGTSAVIGVALDSAGVNQVVPVLSVGYLEGLDLSGVDYNTLVSLSDTPGALDDGAGSPTTVAPGGRVMPATDGKLTKLLLVNFYYNLTVEPTAAA